MQLIYENKKASVADQRAIKQIVFQIFQEKLDYNTILGKSKETILVLDKGAGKVLLEYINDWIQKSKC